MANNTQRSGGAVVLRLIIGLALAAVLALSFNLIHSHSTFFRGSDPDKTVNLNELIDQGAELPVGSFAKLDVRFPVGEFAYEKSTLNGITAGTDHYYLVLLTDSTFMAVKVSNAGEIDQLEKQSDALNNDQPLNQVSGSVPLSGKLERLTDSEIRGFYNDAMTNLGFAANDPSFRLLVLDTTALNYTRVLIAVGVLAAVILIAVIVVKARKKAAQRAEAALSGETPPDDPYHTVT